MNDEIKEILRTLKAKSTRYEYCLKENISYNDESYEAHLLLDYITNLQKENERLKVALKGTTHCYDEEEHKKLKEENERLRTVLNGSEEKRKKSIEYIKSNYIDNPIEFKKELLSILGGDK